MEKFPIRRIHKEEYPPLLREIPDSPHEMFVRGAIPDVAYLAVVGSRRMTRDGKRALSYLINGCANAPFGIVSGLALGIDGLAHMLAVKNHLPTIGVLGSGVSDHAISPRRHIPLAHSILESGGAILSEYAPDEPGYSSHYPERNRIIAGIAPAILVAEADDKSGALITAFLALEYNRDVAVVPQSIFHPNGKGIHRLLKRGAIPITEPNDLFALMNVPTRAHQPALLLTDDERKLLACFHEKSLFLDDICTSLAITVAQAMMLMTPLLQRNILLRERDGSYALTAPPDNNISTPPV
ncbi:MAG: DNA-protecting protein DprA [Candidatus Kerfeldbacteria bacterium]|nr:DNA-protecting protein DprA [Candidatus Kerfeldbacteria bacterium]